MFIQKGKIRFSQKEVWDLDTNLAKIIQAGLVQFKQSKRHGTPSPFLIERALLHKPICKGFFSDIIFK